MSWPLRYLFAALTVTLVSAVPTLPNAADRHGYVMTVTRTCDGPERQGCSELDSRFTFEFEDGATADEALLRLKDTRAIYMQLQSADAENLVLSYAGKDRKGNRHIVTYRAIGLFQYNRIAADGTTTYFAGYLEPRK